MSSSRFANVNEESYEELLKEKDAKNTQRATVVAWNAFLTYVREKGIDFDEGTVDKPHLNDILKKFYVELRKQDGKFYSLKYQR